MVDVRIETNERQHSPLSDKCLRMLFSHPVIEIKVHDAPSEYCLVVGNHYSTAKSKNGVFKMDSFETPLFKALQEAAVSKQNGFLTSEQNSSTLNFSKIMDIDLYFDENLDLNRKYTVTATNYRVYNDNGFPRFL